MKIWKGKKKSKQKKLLCPERPCLWLHARQASNSLLCKDCHQAVCCTNILCLHTVMSQKEMTENQYVKRLCSKTKQSFLQNNITNIQLYIQYIYKYAWQIIAVIRQPKSAMSDRILIYCIYIYISTKTYTDMRCWAGSGLARPFITLAIHTWSYVHNVSKPCKSRNNLNQP